MLIERALRLVWFLKPLRYWCEGKLYRRRSNDAWLEEWKDRFRGQPMLIIGNGPSLNKTPLEEFSHIPSIGLNKIDLLYPRTSWRPNFVLCINDVVARQHWSEWLKQDIPVFLSWKSRWMLPRRHRRSFHYFLGTDAAFRTDLRSGVGSQGTVTYTAMQFAYYCGANPVILFGVDHSFVKPAKDVTYEVRRGPDVDHFDPNYFPEGKLWGLFNPEHSEDAYRRAKVAFEADGRVIYDATIGGKLEIFPKISLDQARELIRRASASPG